ncbi:hypothetical protein BUE93_09660 [Chromobacterium amazonense]|uniref:Uncharacterized protein n=1 Tax=Chromobacterium amazonense TaxID=1382803 RepID=A0A2S9X5G4_9NEIS|nr:hypothetical protein [Chromobacterium amazonense]PRP70915.1 hypothetical protein BUE93_09660 [Chromobacterium amazonense]
MRLFLLMACLGCFLAGAALVDYFVLYGPEQDSPPVFRLDLQAEQDKARAAACRRRMANGVAGVYRSSASRWSGASR